MLSLVFSVHSFLDFTIIFEHRAQLLQTRPVAWGGETLEFVRQELHEHKLGQLYLIIILG